MKTYLIWKLPNGYHRWYRIRVVFNIHEEAISFLYSLAKDLATIDKVNDYHFNINNDDYYILELDQ